MVKIKIEGAVRLLAGSIVLISVFLVLFQSLWWLCLTAFVALNLIQSVFTNFCPAEVIFKRILKKEN